MSASDQRTELQRRLFSRWINGKLSSTRGIHVKDVVEEFDTGHLLVNLMEVLAEVEFPEKLNAGKMRVHKLDNCNRALKFVWAQGVNLRVRPQAENLLDKDERAILGLAWAIILKFVKFGDSDDDLDAKQALLMWIQNRTASYEGANVTDFKASMKDGYALGALIHKHRPQMIDMAQLTPGKASATANWAVVQAAAERYFDLPASLITADEIAVLDEASMFIYASEFYNGIAEQRKLDLAARRIGKLIKFTEVNDALRAQYAERAHAFTTRVARVQEVLNDRTIDDTMAGAKQKLEEFYAYKENDKSSILDDQLVLEGLFNQLSMRLAHHKRPAFVPPEGTSLDAMNATVADLERTEQERKVALHAELNRQIRLLDLDGQHKAIAAELGEYQAATGAYLDRKEVSHSVAAAQYQLRRLDASDEERATVVGTSFARLQALTEELVSERYERSSEVSARDAELAARFDALAAASAAKRPVLDDDAAREHFREQLRLKVEQHVSKHAKVVAWFADREAYLSIKEDVDSVAQANEQLGLLSAYAAEKGAQTSSAVAPFKTLGADILASRYEGLSTYALGDAPDTITPEQLREREADVDAKWVRLDELHAAKRSVLDDDLRREEFREALRIKGVQHERAHAALSSWADEADAYLAVREQISDIPAAKTALSILTAWRADRAAQEASNVAALKALGAEIVGAKYEGEHSTYSYGSAASDTQSIAQLEQREADVDARFAAADEAANAKNAFLDAELEREIDKEENRVDFANQAAAFQQFARAKQFDAANSHFGFTLAEVEAYAAALDAGDAQLKEAQAAKSAEYAATFERGAALGVTENAYTAESPQTLAAAGAALDDALTARRAAYDKELAHQRHIDQLCQSFAALADPFAAQMVATKNSVSASQEELEAQLAFVEQRIGAVEADDAAKLDAINAAQALLDDEGVTNNVHTTLTGKDVSVQHRQYATFLQRKKTMLEEAIEHQRLRGLTPEQFQEIEDNFEQFSKDGVLNARQLKTCLYSLGEEKGPKQIAAIVEEHGDSGSVGPAAFKEFMVVMLGDADTKDEILAGFKLINKGHDQVAQREHLEKVMVEHDVEYLAANAPAADDGFDYPAWTDDVFSR
jgi:Ca2+-binding EF-hand superfamily protein